MYTAYSSEAPIGIGNESWKKVCVIWVTFSLVFNILILIEFVSLMSISSRLLVKLVAFLL